MEQTISVCTGNGHLISINNSTFTTKDNGESQTKYGTVFSVYNTQGTMKFHIQMSELNLM